MDLSQLSIPRPDCPSLGALASRRINDSLTWLLRACGWWHRMLLGQRCETQLFWFPLNLAELGFQKGLWAVKMAYVAMDKATLFDRVLRNLFALKSPKVSRKNVLVLCFVSNSRLLRCSSLQWCWSFGWGPRQLDHSNCGTWWTFLQVTDGLLEWLVKVGYVHVPWTFPTMKIHTSLILMETQDSRNSVQFHGFIIFYTHNSIQVNFEK